MTMRFDRIVMAKAVKKLEWIFSNPEPRAHLKAERQVGAFVSIAVKIVNVVPHVAMGGVCLRFNFVKMMRICSLKVRE